MSGGILDEVIGTAGAFCGESDALAVLCRVAVSQLSGRLKDGVTPESCAEAFVPAAAMMAAAMFSEMAATETGTSFKLGQLSVSGIPGGSASSAEGIRKQAEALMAPFISDGGFSFMKVRG